MDKNERAEQEALWKAVLATIERINERIDVLEEKVAKLTQRVEHIANVADAQ